MPLAHTCGYAAGHLLHPNEQRWPPTFKVKVCRCFIRIKEVVSCTATCVRQGMRDGVSHGVRLQLAGCGYVSPWYTHVAMQLTISSALMNNSGPPLPQCRSNAVRSKRRTWPDAQQDMCAKAIAAVLSRPNLQGSQLRLEITAWPQQATKIPACQQGPTYLIPPNTQYTRMPYHTWYVFSSRSTSWLSIPPPKFLADSRPHNAQLTDNIHKQKRAWCAVTCSSITWLSIPSPMFPAYSRPKNAQMG
jgi:hypothetical protein